MYNTTNHKKIDSLLSKSEEIVKILLEKSIFPGMAEDLNELKAKLYDEQVISLTTDTTSSPSGKELHFKDVCFSLVNSYSYIEASNIQDVFYQIDGTNLRVAMVSNRLGLLIGKGGQAFNRVLEELKKEFISEKWGFSDVKLELIEQKFRFSDYHFEGIGDY